MRFMTMHRHDANSEAGLPPPKGLIEEMGQFIGGHAKAGRLVDGAGLGASKTRTRLTFKNGQATVKHGPYTGEHELPASTLVLKVKTKEEALGWAERYGKILGDGEIELGKINEPWDLGMMPEPPNHPLQFLLIEKSDAATESGSRSAKQKADLTRLKTEMTKAGVLTRSYQLAPSKQAKRLFFKNNDLRIVDGPFAETKELLGGFAILDLKDFDDAIEQCRIYARILGGTLEIDLRLVEPNEE